MTQEESSKCNLITTAALELIADQGFHGTPISQIAKRAGVGVGSIYRYFADKDEMIHAIHARIEEKMHQSLASGMDSTLVGRERFLRLVKLLVQHLAKNPLEFKFLEQYYNSPFGTEKMREKFLEDPNTNSIDETPFCDLLTKGRGTLIKDLPVPMIHSLAFGPMTFLVRDYLSGFLELNDDLLQQFAESCWDAIRL